MQGGKVNNSDFYMNGILQKDRIIFSKAITLIESTKKEDELLDNWINCFYNKEQAMQAYALADRLLSEHYDWPKGENNWLKLNLAVVELMYKKLDEVR